MTLITELEHEVQDAMRAGDAERRDALRLILSSLKSAEKDPAWRAAIREDRVPEKLPPFTPPAPKPEEASAPAETASAGKAQ